jgi:hypothetical protein
LLQSSAVQKGGFFITALSFEDASGYDWAAGGAAIIFALIAPVLYLKAPSHAKQCRGLGISSTAYPAAVGM